MAVDVERLLAEFDVLTQNTATKDRVLFLLLKEIQDELPNTDEGSEWFHAAFRKIDVSGSGYRDMAIYILLSDSAAFWELYHRLDGENK